MVTILLQNQTNISDELLYIYVTDGNNNFYQLSSNYKWVANSQQTMCNILYSQLPKNSENMAYFYLSSSANITGGEIWFSDSATALSGGGSSGISQPSANATFVFDHVEFAITSNSNINVDTTSVDQLGIPITMLINPTVTKGSSLLSLAKGQNFPSVIGTTPGLSMHEIVHQFNMFVASAAPLVSFNACSQTFNNNGVTTQRLVAPVHLIKNYESGVSPTTLATIMDHAIYELFKYYSKSTNTLTFQDPVTGNQYQGNVTKINDANGSTYTVFQFTGPAVSSGGISSSTFNIYYPFFSTNCSASPNNNEFTPGGPPPTPTCWGKTMPSAMPPTAMLLACAGVFGDAAAQYPPPPPAGQPANALQALLGNLENQLVSLLNRGLSPHVGNLVSFNLPAYSANQISPPDLKNLTEYSDPNPSANVTNPSAYGVYTLPVKNNCIYFGASVTGTVKLGDGSTQTFTYSGGTSKVSNYSGSSTYLSSVQQYDSQNNKLQLMYSSAVKPLPVLTVIQYSCAPLLSSQYALINQISPFPAGLQEGMQIVDQHTQPASVYYINSNDSTIIIQSTNNTNLVAELAQWLICGNFYPMQGTTPIGLWNAYSGFLHNGNGTTIPAPLINNLGYGYAYDDQGGYSNDLTVNFDNNNSATIGILLNPVFPPIC